MGAGISVPVEELRAGLLSEFVRGTCEESAAVAPSCDCTHDRLLPSPALHRFIMQVSDPDIGTSDQRCFRHTVHGLMRRIHPASFRRKVPLCSRWIYGSSSTPPAKAQCLAGGGDITTMASGQHLLACPYCHHYFYLHLSRLRRQKSAAHETTARRSYCGGCRAWPHRMGACLPNRETQPCGNGDLIAGGDILQLSC